MNGPSIVEDIFLAALNQNSAEELTAFLDQACGTDADIRRRVERLLDAHPNARNFLALSAEQFSRRVLPADQTHAMKGDLSGTIIGGRYQLLEQIGEGGMGSVWRAQQTEPVRRQVAVKLIKAGMDSRAVIGRFETERQALAVMDHPNIARILDGGLHEDRPYFVMELVKGVPITTFCDARKLTPAERLELFVPVCQAIQHAHQKGIIHRDIKPANVLIALYDDRPIPKVIDFGVAKATGNQLIADALLTAFGGVIGTPQYMSPEQASLNNLDIDTRSDVYSLGVLLYELLAGSPPFQKKELDQAGLMEILRVVREEDPPRPSMKLSTAGAFASLSANRGTEPQKLTGILRNELDWIVMKALEKSRERRYESASNFASDISRYLSGEQVQAVPPSVGYRAQKWVRKNRRLVTTVCVFAVAILIGQSGLTVGYFRANQAAREAREAGKKTEAALETAEMNLVQSYLSPIGYQVGPIGQAELVALDELSRHSEDRVKLLFLRECLRDGPTAERVSRRTEQIIQAVVGTGLQRRQKALEYLSEKQRDSQADPRVRVAAFWLTVELGSDDLPALRESITHQILATPNFGLSVFQLRNLKGKYLNEVADQLLVLLPEQIGASNYHEILVLLTNLADQLDQSAHSRISNHLIEVYQRPELINVRNFADQYLKVTAFRAEPRVAIKIFETLFSDFSKPNRSISDDLFSLLTDPRWKTVLGEAKYAKLVGQSFDRMLKNLKENLAYQREPLPFHHFDAKQAWHFFEELIVEMRDPPRDNNPIPVTVKPDLISVVGKLDAKDARRAHSMLIEKMESKSVSGQNWNIMSALAAMVPKLDRERNKQSFILLMARLNDSIFPVPERIYPGADSRVNEWVAVLSKDLDSDTAQLYSAKLMTAFLQAKDPGMIACLQLSRRIFLSLFCHLPKDVQNRHVEALIFKLAKNESDEYWPRLMDLLLKLVPQMHSSDREIISARLAEIVFETQRKQDYFADVDFINRIVCLLRNINSVPVLANLLKKARCTGNLREALLRRLEEIAYPAHSQGAMMVGLGLSQTNALSLTLAYLDHEARFEKNRKFRFVSDASAWIADHFGIDMASPPEPIAK